MKVIHIIPAAFDYFQDIEKNSFSLMQKENELGLESEAFSIHYGSVTKKNKISVRESAPSSRFLGMINAKDVFAEFAGFDLIHLHCPFFGLAKSFIKWKVSGNKPLVVTYHRDFKISDMFSVFIKGYLNYYLPKIFDLSDVIVSESAEYFNKSQGKRFLNDANKLFDLSDISRQIQNDTNIHLTQGTDKIKLTIADAHALAYIKLYKSLI